MAEPIQMNTLDVVNGTNGSAAKPLTDVLDEVKRSVEGHRVTSLATQSVKDLRWQFDQVSAKMNQAIYNDEFQKIHETCLQTVSVLIEILARTH